MHICSPNLWEAEEDSREFETGTDNTQWNSVSKEEKGRRGGGEWGDELATETVCYESMRT